MQTRQQPRNYCFFTKLILISFLLSAGIRCNPSGPEKPDYVVDEFTYPSNPQSIGTSGSVDFSIKNNGIGIGTNPVDVSLYISPYIYYDENNVTLLTSTTLPPLTSGETSALQTLNYTIPPEATISSYFLLKIDTTDDELDTYNNISSSTLISVPNGNILRNIINVNDAASIYSISSFETQYFFINTTINHAYNIYWDDYSEGAVYYQSSTGANVKVTSTSSDGLTTFFSQVDNGYYIPQTSFSSDGTDIYIDVATSGLGGNYNIQVIDIGIPPDLTISITNTNYSGGSLQISYKIDNLSTLVATDGTGFTIGFWSNQTTQPTPATPTDLNVTLSNVIIPAGGSYSGSASLAVTNPGGTVNAYAYVDIFNNLAETSKSNNLSAPAPW